ncbi:hypothetical protein [Nocardia sp. NPDC051463]|uniref:hypothetical protein n=1 Tax=Nocardia sp. NPDC051463 TaxID=3154845 RepID=UPI00344D4BF3
MTPWWIDLLGYGWELVVVGLFLSVLAYFWTRPGEEYSGAPATEDDDPIDEDPDDWDRARDRWIDREAGVW